MAVKCAYHPEADAAGACVSCGRLICTECKVEVGGKIHCNPCIEKMLLDKAETRPTKVEPVAAAVTTATNATATATKLQDKPKTAVEKSEEIDAAENTSGQGKAAVVPQEIKKWSWGAFLMNWIWGLGNSVWIALISLIPVPLLGLIMACILGAKGNEWAWQSKKWESIEQFKKTQRAWAVVGVILLCVSLAIGIVVAVFSIIVGPINVSMPS